MPEYPDDIFEYLLTFKNLTDFAVASDNNILFADSGVLVHWENETRTVYKELEAPVTDVDYEDGTFYYSLDGGETSYVFPYPLKDKLPENPEPVKHVYPTENEINVFEGYHYYYNNDELYVLNENTPKEPSTSLGNFIKAKVYKGQLYGVHKNSVDNTSFHKIDGNRTNPVNITFSNYNRLTTISVGDVPEKLKAPVQLGDKPQFVQIESEALLTELNVNNLITYGDDDNPYFSVIEPNNTHKSLIGKTALLLCESGNVRIVAHGKSAYIMHKDNASDFQYDARTPVEAGTKATVNIAGEYAHSLPFMSNATRTFAIAPNEEVTVLYKISKDSGILAYDFYLIQNSKGDQGYVISKNLNLNQPPINEGQPYDKADPDPNTDNSVKIVILVIVVIALALTAVGYLTWVSTSGKRRTVKNKNSGEIELNDKPEENKNVDKK